VNFGKNRPAISGPCNVRATLITMHKFPITQFRKFEELPFDKFDTLRFSVYIIDFDWNYLFVNKFVRENLGSRGNNLIGKNMWTTFPELASDAAFIQLRTNMDKRIAVNINTTSPLTSQRLNITGYPMDDCLYFSSSIIPDKEELINELRHELTKKNKH
jgi:hypothetical protein